jgi:hypothetical protein
MSDELTREQHQMLMCRPWDVAGPEELWCITGAYPASEGPTRAFTTTHTFTDCIAITLPGYVTGSDRPLFVFVGALASVNQPVDPAWITKATPLLLVLRDEPARAYYEQDQVWIKDWQAQQR